MSAADRGELEAAAAAAVARLERSRAMGRQLSLLDPVPASPEEPDAIEAPRGPGRPPGAKNKRTSKLRQMLAARGYRMPEDVLTELAGLSSREDAVTLAMQRAELVLTWAFGSAAPASEAEIARAKLAGETLDAPSGGQRLGAFLAILKEQTAATAALLPYGLEKAGDQGEQGKAPVVLVMPGAQAPSARPGDGARDVTPGDASLAPPPMPASRAGEEPDA